MMIKLDVRKIFTQSTHARMLMRDLFAVVSFVVRLVANILWPRLKPCDMTFSGVALKQH